MSPYPPLQRLKPVVRGGRIFGHGQIIAAQRQREQRDWKTAFYANTPPATKPTRQHQRREARLAMKREAARLKADAIRNRRRMSSGRAVPAHGSGGGAV